MAASEFTDILRTNYIYKVAIEVLFTPVTYVIITHLKRAEQEDFFDGDTDFNPIELGREVRASGVR